METSTGQRAVADQRLCQWYGLQNHPKRHADHGLQLLLAKLLRGRWKPRSQPGPGHRWKLLRDNGRWRTNGFASGTVFKITPSGTLTTVYSFCSQSFCADGGSPAASLVQATDGNFYGTTGGGGPTALPVVRSSKSPQAAR